MTGWGGSPKGSLLVLVILCHEEGETLQVKETVCVVRNICQPCCKGQRQELETRPMEELKVSTACCYLSSVVVVTIHVAHILKCLETPEITERLIVYFNFY